MGMQNPPETINWGTFSNRTIQRKWKEDEKPMYNILLEAGIGNLFHHFRAEFVWTCDPDPDKKHGVSPLQSRHLRKIMGPDNRTYAQLNLRPREKILLREYYVKKDNPKTSRRAKDKIISDQMGAGTTPEDYMKIR